MSEENTEIEQNSTDSVKEKFKGFNDATVSGIVMQVDKKKSGSLELWLNTDPSRSDTEMKGATIPSFHTSTLFIRVPKPLVQRLGADSFAEGSNLIVKAFMTGVRRVIEGQGFDIVEVRAKDVSFVNDGSNQKSKKHRGINQAILSGLVENVEHKKSGSMEVWINTNTTRQDTPLKGAAVASFFTSTIFVRIPKPVVERIGKEKLAKGVKAIIPSRLKGVRRITDGHPYDVVEVQALDAIPA